jgi:hypothetical protein
VEHFTQVSVKETNQDGYGFECTVAVDPGISDMVTFDISWLHEDEDGSVEALETVGVLMTPEAARHIAERLQQCAYLAEKASVPLENKVLF